MKDSFGRTIDYARLSITDRCNLRCTYCMPNGGIAPLSHDEILRFEEILRLAHILTTIGINRFKVTGGEPFVRGGAIDFIAALKQLDGVSQVTLTTNGILLDKYMPKLAEIGIDGINISLDTLDPIKFHALTGSDALPNVLDAIDSCVSLGIRTKTNTVLLAGVNEDDILGIAELARKQVAAVRFIELMPVGQDFSANAFPISRLMNILEDNLGKLEPIHEKLGNGPAIYYRLDGFCGKIGIIPAMSRSFCESCNRIRLTSDGFLKLCLSHTDGLNLRTLLRNNSSDTNIANHIAQAIASKPELSGFDKASTGKPMHKIGG